MGFGRLHESVLIIHSSAKGCREGHRKSNEEILYFCFLHDEILQGTHFYDGSACDQLASYCNLNKQWVSLIKKN